MMQLSLLEIRPLMTPEQVESRQREITKRKRAYSKLKEIALTADGMEAYNAAVMAKDLRLEIERLESEVLK